MQDPSHLQTNFEPVDFRFVYSLEEDDLNFFFDITDFGVESMVEVIKEDKNYVTGLQPGRVDEIIAYFNSLLELYTDFELYEECEDILFVLNTMEDYKKDSSEQVGNVNEKH